MVIGYDAKKIICDNDEIAEYGRMMIDALSGCYIHNHYMIYTPKEMENKLLSPFLSRSTVHLKTPRSTLFGCKWRRGKGVLRNAKRHGVRVFHGLNGMLPGPLAKSHMHSVVNVPFTRFIDEPETCGWMEKAILNHDVKKSTSFANRIITATNTAKQSLMERYGIDEGRINVVYPGCDDRYHRDFTENELKSIAHKYGLPKRYILLLGDITPKSGAMLLTEVLNQLKDEDVCLLLIGKGSSFYQKNIKEFAHRHGIRHRIMHISKVHQADIPAILHMATVLALPKAGQSNVMMLAKAQCCLTPTVVASDAMAQEVGDGAALYAQADDCSSFAQAIDSILANEALRQRLIDTASARRDLFTKQAMADSVMAIYEKISENHHKR